MLAREKLCEACRTPFVDESPTLTRVYCTERCKRAAKRARVAARDAAFARDAEPQVRDMNVLADVPRLTPALVTLLEKDFHENPDARVVFHEAYAGVLPDGFAVRAVGEATWELTCTVDIMEIFKTKGNI